MQRKNLLFIWSRNRWRSPTAERLFARAPRYRVRFRGLSAGAARRLTGADLAWADDIFVMEYGHKRQLLRQFSPLVAGRTIHVLDIPDDYQYMDPHLVELIEVGVHAALAAL